MDDSCIVDLFWARSEEAIIETERTYGRYCRFIARQILRNDADAEEVVNDTYLKTWNSIPPNRPVSLKSYVGMITRQLALDAYEAKTTRKRGGEIPLVLEELSECIPDTCDDAELGESVALRDALNRFVRSLPERTQAVFIQRYWYASSVADVARAFGMKESSVTVLMLRTRRKLKKFLEEEGFCI